MREGIRRLLIDNVAALRVEASPGVTDYTESRVFERGRADASTPKPFAVVTEGAQDPGEDWAGIATAVEVYPFVEYESYTDLDVLTDQIKLVLDNARFEDDGKQYLAELISTGADEHAQEWDALTRMLRFNVFDLSWYSAPTDAPDPVAALVAWTEAQFPDAGTDPATWDPRAATPGIYWRFAGSPRILEHFPRHVWLEARFMGHVIAPQYTDRLTWTRRLHERLAVTRKIMLSDDSPMFFEGVGADSAVNPMRQGQITVVARYGVLVPQAAVEVINEATWIEE